MACCAPKCCTVALQLSFTNSSSRYQTTGLPCWQSGRHMEAFVSLLTFSLYCLLQQTLLVSQCPAQWRCSGRDKRLWMCRRGHGQSVAMARSSVNPGSKFSSSFALHICVLAGLLASHTLATDGRNHTAFRSVKKKKIKKNRLNTF